MQAADGTDEGVREEDGAAAARVAQVLSPLLGARCLVVSGATGVVVVDAGALVADEAERLVRASGRRPLAVLATHGHLDHVWDAGLLAERLDVPVVVHPADRYRLDDPVGTLGLPAGVLTGAGLDAGSYRPPVDVRVLGDDGVDELLDLGGARLVPLHLPGHTEGSTAYLLNAPGLRAAALVGDVLFAGSVGRTDLPGGDGAAMTRSLTRLVGELKPTTTVVPGHGPVTELATELATNPYLRALR